VKTKTKAPKYVVEIEAPSNGRLSTGTLQVIAKDTGDVIAADKANIASIPEVEKAAARLAAKLTQTWPSFKSKKGADELRKKVEEACNLLLNQRRAQKAREQAQSAMPPPEPEQEISESERILKETPEHVCEAARTMLCDPRLIQRVVVDIAALGVAGEAKLTATIYVVFTSRKLPRPLNAIVQGPSASGKSYPVEQVAGMFPPEDAIFATQMTPQTLFHMRPGSLKHRLIVGGERSRLENDDRAEATRALREMISSGRLSKLMPVKGEGGVIQTELIKQDGPIAFVETTTLAKIFDEDANRCILLQTDERPEQTRRVYDAVAGRYGGDFDRGKVDEIIQRHRTAQRLLEQAEVVIPFAKALTDRLTADRVEGRRAVGQILGAVAAVALLHQFQRERDAAGRVLATADDYAIVRKLLGGPMGRILGGRMSDAAYRFYERLKSEALAGQFTTTEVVRKKLGAERTVRGWLHELHDNGFLDLVEEGKGRKPSSWRLSKDSPEENNGFNLPAVSDVFPGNGCQHADNA
jgi:hypothetical protein